MKRVFTDNPDDTEEEIERDAARQFEIIDALPPMPATTPQGVKVKVVALQELVVAYHEREREDALFESILADLDRMTGGAS